MFMDVLIIEFKMVCFLVMNFEGSENILIVLIFVINS